MPLKAPSGLHKTNTPKGLLVSLVCEGSKSPEAKDLFEFNVQIWSTGSNSFLLMTSGHPGGKNPEEKSIMVQFCPCCLNVFLFSYLQKEGHFPNFLPSKKNTASPLGSETAHPILLSHFNCRQKASVKLLRHPEKKKKLLIKAQGSPEKCSLAHSLWSPYLFIFH